MGCTLSFYSIMPGHLINLENLPNKVLFIEFGSSFQLSV